MCIFIVAIYVYVYKYIYLYNLASILSISLQPNGFSQNTVGQRQEVICSIFIPINVDLDSITLAWLNKEDIVTTDGRVTIDESSGNSSAGNISVTIRFDPLFEDDANNYTCYALINGSFVFESMELQNRSKQAYYGSIILCI